jgi:predicted negative regulator of RcsB-dependent stress response
MSIVGVILDFFPDDFKRELLDGIVDFVATQAKKLLGDEVARKISALSSQEAFNQAFDQAMKRAVKRFNHEYVVQDEDLVAAITADRTFWASKSVQQGLKVLIRRPGSWVLEEQEKVAQHFTDVLPQRMNRERVDKAVSFFLRCIVEELWTLPGAKEIREIYSLQFQKIQTEAARQQIALAEAQLQATTQLSTDIRQALFQLATKLEERLLAEPSPQSSFQIVRPFHNLPQPDYKTFIGRTEDLDWLRQCLSPSDRIWQMVITGIGGVGKSALALRVADDYCRHYKELLPEDRFEAIIWISAKEEILTMEGQKASALSGFIFHTLEDMYTTIAQTLGREDITRAVSPEEQNRLAQKALSAQRTLLIVDNLESVTDDRVKTFLRNLPSPTKCIITSREWVSVADVLKLMGLSFEDAQKMIREEATARAVKLRGAEEHQLIERTGGLPLPIKLSIARMASGETFQQVLRWLGNTTGDLPEYCIKGQIDLVQQNDPHAWNLLLVCSLFNREVGASREALGTIADLSLCDRDDGLTLLQRLFLLNPINDNRFSMLPMVQGYAGAQLVGADCGKILIERWLSWLLEFTQYYSVDLEFCIERKPTVDAEYPHILYAIRWCHEHKRWETLLQLVEGIWFYPYLVGLFGELREMLEGAWQASKQLQDERNEGRWLYRLGLLLSVQRQDEKALRECLEKAENIAQRYEDHYILGQVIYLFSGLSIHQDRIEEAELQAGTLLEIGEQLNNLELKNLAASRLVECASKTQQFDKALEWLDQGEKWCRELNWKRGLAWHMYRRGTILARQEKSIMAEPSFVQSLTMATSWNDRRLMAYNKYRLVQIYAHSGQISLACKAAEEARDLCERLGMSVELASIEKLLRNLPKTRHS